MRLKGIKSWAEQDRPREKLMHQGPNALTDSELIAILLATGTKDLSAIDVAKNLLNSVDNNLNDLGKQSIVDLKKVKGIGEAKAITIAAALELGRRRLKFEGQQHTLTSSKEVFNLMYEILADRQVEQTWALFLNIRNKVLGKKMLGQGGYNWVHVDLKVLFNHALEFRATSLILVHNHPSGSLQPSTEDQRMTDRIYEAGKLLDITLADHIIIAQNGYYSFADQGRIG